MHERIKQVMAKTFGVGLDKIHADASINLLEEWDSLRHLELMLALEFEFTIRISTDDMVQLTSLQTIEDYLLREVVQA